MYNSTRLRALPARMAGDDQGSNRIRRGLTFIPYLLRANRGESKMTVWVNE